MTGVFNWDFWEKMRYPSQEQLDNCTHTPEIEQIDVYYKIYCKDCLLWTADRSKEQAQTNWKEKVHIKCMYPIW